MKKDRIFKIRQQLRERIPFSLGLLGVLAVMLFLFYLLGYVNQMDTIYKYTYLEPINQTGTLTSNRLKPLWWIEFLAGIFRLLFLFMTIVRVALYKQPWVINIHIFVTVLYLVVEIAGSVLYGIEYECCNNSPLDEGCSGENNCCNDYRWCCTYGHLTDSCLNVLQPSFNCTPNVTSDDLTPNTEFSISFALTLGHALFGLIALCLSYAARKTLLVKRIFMGEVINDDGLDVFDIGSKYDKEEYNDSDDNANDDDGEYVGKELYEDDGMFSAPSKKSNYNKNEIILDDLDSLKIN